ncbi:diguanylate cyclase domain-containing protein [Eisenbergiella sp.]
MKFNYSYSELQSEMSVLENTFDIVRLVDPFICRTIKISKADGAMTLAPGKPCYSVWEKRQQCVNCISARAMKAKSACTKFEYMQEHIYQIFCRYILLEDRELILELVTDITDSVLNGEEAPEEIENEFLFLNDKMVTDPVSLAYHPHYIDEHLINAAAHSGRNEEAFHLALININNLEDIRRELGELACKGVLRAVADAAREMLADTGEGSFLARFDDSSFFLATGCISHEELQNRLLELVRQASCLPILFHGKPVSPRLSAGFLTCPPGKYHIFRECGKPQPPTDGLMLPAPDEYLQAGTILKDVRELLEQARHQPSGIAGRVL